MRFAIPAAIVALLTGYGFLLYYVFSHPDVEGTYYTCPNGYSVMSQREANGDILISCG